jgi:glutamate 5-kinase
MSVRGEVTGAGRVVVKVGSSSLTTAEGGIDPDRVRLLVDAVAATRARGAEVVLVSSGAIAAGLAPLGLPRRPRDLATQQAAASVGQGLLVHRYTEELSRHGLTAGQVLLTLDDVTRRNHYRIVNENDTVATSEIRFGDNDRLAALVAHLVHADALVLLSDVDGLYDGHPSLPGTQLLSDVRDEADLDAVETGSAGSAVGTGGMQTKVEAARIATGAGIPVVLTSAANAGRALAGEEVGTLFAATGRRRPTRLLWLAHATEAKGVLHLDAGAVHALTERRASLLPAGITAVTGHFAGGDPVDLVDPEGRAVARGLVNYDSDELPGLLGRSTHDLARELGASYEREVVHRDDRVVLAR